MFERIGSSNVFSPGFCCAHGPTPACGHRTRLLQSEGLAWSGVTSLPSCSNFCNFSPLEVTVISQFQKRASLCQEKKQPCFNLATLAVFTWRKNKQAKQSSNRSYISDNVKIIQTVLRKSIREDLFSNTSCLILKKIPVKFTSNKCFLINSHNF